MRAELFIQFGEDDQPVVGSLEDDAKAVCLDVIDNFDDLDFGIGQFLSSIERLNVAPKERAVDLLIVAATAYFADTGFCRSTYSIDGWTRRFLLHIPVSAPAEWQVAAGHLARMLKFLTGDFWAFRFRARRDEYSVICEPPDELDLSDFDCVSLFSGGLDSLVGAIDLLSDGRKPLLISHYWDGEASAAQKALHAELIEKFGNDSMEIIRGRIGVARSDMPGAGSENTQRVRSFLFYSMAAAAVDALDSTDKVLIPENGLIALNVPMERLRLGSLSTHTAHPFFIASMNALTELVGISADFENPYQFMTKGEMVKGCKDQAFLAEIASQSMSCSSPAKVRWQGAAPQHCGHCIPCLIRRASLKAGLPSDDDTEYFLDDLTGEVLDSKEAKGKDIRSFLFAADTIKRSPARIPLVVRKPGPLPAAAVANYAEVYRRGMAEVMHLLKGVKSRHG